MSSEIVVVDRIDIFGSKLSSVQACALISLCKVLTPMSILLPSWRVFARGWGRDWDSFWDQVCVALLHTEVTLIECILLLGQ